ncbi:hypothetical protein CA850_26350 [Micromonospora echinospora]|uniref:Uncharacterized protein n=1 Tax=Micromonospora echinospora TaxID=1877 RepID=A0A1C4VLF0_MICEC|nr:hypothetical protein [Micromonospora echinospora]OZV76740.1 hypothetical protein CA850_26350 [Micromonospora echinospora]SCE84770.1 hypothetical protein GA0070618_1361 [Micromonospora echinospora]
MAALSRKELLFAPLYRTLTVRDYTLPDQAGTSEAIAAAQHHVAASNGAEIFIICAQDMLKIRTVIELHNTERPEANPGDWTERLLFELPFPSAEAHMGDGFGNAVVMELPHPGIYKVDVLYRGRNEAISQTLSIAEEFATMPTPQSIEWREQWAGIEEYRILLRPA